MQHTDEKNVPVKAKAVLVDPESMTVLWANESAAQGLPDRGDAPVSTVPIEQLVPMAEELGVPEALRAAADTGEAQHLHVKLVPMSKGSVAMVVSVYRLPDGNLLVLTENAWQHRTAGGDSSQRSRRGR